MDKMLSNRDKILTLTRSFLARTTGYRTEVTDTLYSGIEKIIDEVLGSGKYLRDLKKYEKTQGPKLKSGVCYSARQVLEMNVYDFIEAHRRESHHLSQYVIWVAEALANEHESLEDISVMQVVEVSKSDAVRYNHVGYLVFRGASQYMVENDKINLGVPL